MQIYNIDGKEYKIDGTKLISTIDGKEHISNKYIGQNYVNGFIISSNLSSFNGSFDKEKISISSGLDDIILTEIGDITGAYELLDNYVNKYTPTTFEELCQIVYIVINEYFNGINNISKRMDYYISEEELENKECNRISNLKGTGAAMCVERAALAQNLLKKLNINSLYKASSILKDGNKEVHAYNLVEYNENYYLFDASIPSIKSDKVTPLITSLPYDVYEKLSCPLAKIGYSVKIFHFNPLRNVNVDIIYDNGRKDIFDANIQKINDEKTK